MWQRRRTSACRKFARRRYDADFEITRHRESFVEGARVFHLTCARGPSNDNLNLSSTRESPTVVWESAETLHAYGPTSPTNRSPANRYGLTPVPVSANSSPNAVYRHESVTAPLASSVKESVLRQWPFRSKGLPCGMERSLNRF